MMSGKLKCKVRTGLGDFSFTVSKSATGKDVFDKVTKCIDVLEVWYFGLTTIDGQGQTNWLNLNKPLLDQNLRNSRPICLTLTFKYYPEDVMDIKQNLSKVLLYLHVRSDIKSGRCYRPAHVQLVLQVLLYLHVRSNIMSGRCYCPANVQLLLAGYAAQAKYGDFDLHHKPGYLANGEILPMLVLDTHYMRAEDLEERVCRVHEAQRGISRGEAMMRYMSLAQDLNAFGLRQFHIKTDALKDALVAIDSGGIRIFSTDDILVPVTCFTLGELKSVRFSGRRVTLTFFSVRHEELNLRTPDMAIAKSIFVRIVGYYDIFSRNRMPDTQVEADMAEELARQETASPRWPSSKTESVVKAEQAEVRKGIAERFKQYDHVLRETQKELAGAVMATKREGHRLQQTEKKFLAASYNFESTVREKQFYDTQATIHRASIPKVAKRHRKVSKRELGLQSEAVLRGEEYAAVKSQMSGLLEAEEDIRTRLQEFHVHPEVLVNEAGVAENDDCVEAAADLAMPVVDFASPWERKNPLVETDDDIRFELEEVMLQLKPLKSESKDWLSELDERSTQDGNNKYREVSRILKHTLAHRISLINEIGTN